MKASSESGEWASLISKVSSVDLAAERAGILVELPLIRLATDKCASSFLRRRTERKSPSLKGRKFLPTATSGQCGAVPGQFRFVKKSSIASPKARALLRLPALDALNLAKE